MSQNDTTINPTQGADVYAGVRNPTASSTNTDPLADNFVTDPATGDVGAGADPNIDYGKVANRGFKQTAGVVEGRPGIIESTNIDPLNESSNKDDGWANATTTPGTTGTTSSSTAANAAAGAGKFAYGHVTGDETLKEEGRKDIKDTTGY
ncbi:hypothetical protein CALCODRAFT_470095 [Calocera cornea HHB12733]|uniref:Uncharacterized protein n=1 Tax=Calocera cornea HHB12733 TaxID=1353952 RepID=A0A165FQ67_9BASI|nr:hypothetical protein CALCODRAFT_470095 [Calocera cornea HHB12733]